MGSYLFEGYLRINECNESNWDANSGLRLLIPSRYLLHNRQIHENIKMEKSENVSTNTFEQIA